MLGDRFYVKLLASDLGVAFAFGFLFGVMPPFAKKIELLSNKLKFNYDKKVEPFLTVETLRRARNELAHGKPVEFNAKAASNKELAAKMRSAWGVVDDPETVLAFFEQARAFKSLLFTKAKIKWATSLTSAFGGG